MTIYLASPWVPRGETARLLRYYEALTRIYDGLVVGLSSPEERGAAAALESLGVAFTYYERFSGRHAVLKLALEAGADYIQYIDMDRLVRWIELRPDELAAVARQVRTVDTLIIGRSEDANNSHSRTLTETERIPNLYFSHYFGRRMDFAAGSRGFSRRAAELVLRHSTSDSALWMDAGWAVLVKRAGYSWDYVVVEGLDWETADRYRDRAATREEQQALADEQDQDPHLWLMRARVAQEITRYGLLAMELPLDVTAGSTPQEEHA